MRVGFFGGTFDPVHRGHLTIAREAAREYLLDEVAFAPVGRQPLKVKDPEACYADRLRMVELACAGGGESGPVLTVSHVDAPRADGLANYTVDSLAAFAARHRGAEFYSISGADSFLTIRSWRDPDRLLELARWIVVSRPGFQIGEPQLSSIGLTPAQRARVFVLSSVHEDVSASQLRQRLRAGEDVSDWVPQSILEYIRAKGLYGTATSAPKSH